MTPEQLPSGTSSPPTPRERLMRRATPNSSTPCSLIPKPAASGFPPTKNSNRRETALSPNAPPVDAPAQ
ncbi:MAG: hypothetical protein RLZZ142_843 [Verrucomicrobiota bacterium]